MSKRRACYLFIGIILSTAVVGILCWIKISRLEIQSSNITSSEEIHEENIIAELSQITPSVILFFNTQCDLCLAEVKLMKEHIGDLSNMYSVFFVSFEPKQSIYSFLNSQGINTGNNIHIIADEKMILLDQYKIKGYPSFIIQSKDHKIIYRGTAIDSNIMLRLLKQNDK